MGIKAIETSYKGYRFRSRLEARWAVYFDAAKINWLYEPEGFDVGNGTRYLPDFLLPDFSTYVEVKPEQPDGDELEKIVRFGEHQTIILADGLPERRWYHTSKCLPCKTNVYVESLCDSEHYLLWPHHHGGLVGAWGEALYYLNDEPNFDFAVNSARSARFEHGESGAG